MDDIRARVLRRRNTLSPHLRKQYSKVICERLQPLLKGTVAAYCATGSEVDLSYLDTKGIRMCLPVCDKDSMSFYYVDEATAYQKGSFGIWEPVHAQQAEPQELDILLVPLVAFDEACNRMGHGRGYYDRYLPQCRAKTIGIAFACQKDRLQLHAQDVPLDMIVSEESIYTRT